MTASPPRPPRRPRSVPPRRPSGPRRLGPGALALLSQPGGLAADPLDLRASLQRRVARPRRTASSVTIAAPSRVARVQPAGRSAWSASADGSPRRPPPEPGRGRPIRPDPADRVGEKRAARRREAIEEPAGRRVRAGGRTPGAFADHEHAAFAGEGRRGRGIDDVRPRELVERRLDRGPEGGIDLQLVVEAPPAVAPRGPGNPPLLVLAQPALDCMRRAPGRPGPRRRRLPLLRRPSTGVRIGRHGACLGQRTGRRPSRPAVAVRRRRPGQPPAVRRAPAVALRPASAARPLGLQPAIRLGQPPGLRSPPLPGAPPPLGGSLPPPCPAPGSPPGVTRARRSPPRAGDPPPHRSIQVVIAGRQRQRQRTSLDCQGRVCRFPLLADPTQVPLDRFPVAGKPGCRAAGARSPPSAPPRARPALPFGRRALAEVGRDGGRCLLSRPGARPSPGRPRAAPVPARRPTAAPAAACSSGHGRRRAGRWRARRPPRAGSSADRPGSPEPPGLRAELGEDVLDPREIRLGLGQAAPRPCAVGARGAGRRRPPRTAAAAPPGAARAPGRPSPGR